MSLRRFALALLLGTGAMLGSSAHAASTGERIEISSPIFPRTSVLYPHEGSAFPSTPEAEATLAHDAALTFDTLLESCALTHPDITLAAEGVVLTAEELARNYNEVAQCAYTTYTVKPYWIPQLVDDVDLCGTELGAGWHLPTEADVAGFTEDEFTFLHETLTATSDAGGGSFGTFYFSLNVFVRATDGSIKKANLAPDVEPRVTPLAAMGDARKMHDESATSLRCIRRTPLP